MIAVKERPILFSSPMVRAILAGAKTQTRRVVKQLQGMDPADVRLARTQGGYPDGVRPVWECDFCEPDIFSTPCPYGQPGDRLWVRETWQSVPFGPHRDWPGCPDLRPQKPSEWNRTAVVIWRADGEMPGSEIWRPSIHMPRWASRIMLEITGVRVERLNDISEDDAAAEGVGPGYVPNSLGSTTCVGCRPMFARVWRDINGPCSWDANPWVWVVDFKRIEGGV